MAAGGYLKIYSNDGATLLFTSTNYYSVTDNMTVTETGVTLANEAYTYSGDKIFLGVSSSVNATEAEKAVGSIWAIGAFSHYIVEEEPEEPTVTSQGEIYYNGNLVDTLIEGEFIVLHAKDFKFLGDIVIKNVGEATGAFTHKYTGDRTETRTFNFTIGMTWAEWCESEYETEDIYIDSSDNSVRCNGGMNPYPYLYDANNNIVYADNVIVNGTVYTTSYSSAGSND